MKLILFTLFLSWTCTAAVANLDCFGHYCDYHRPNCIFHRDHELKGQCGDAHMCYELDACTASILQTNGFHHECCCRDQSCIDGLKAAQASAPQLSCFGHICDSFTQACRVSRGHDRLDGKCELKEGCRHHSVCTAQNYYSHDHECCCMDQQCIDNSGPSVQHSTLLMCGHHICDTQSGRPFCNLYYTGDRLDGHCTDVHTCLDHRHRMCTTQYDTHSHDGCCCQNATCIAIMTGTYTVAPTTHSPLTVPPTPQPVTGSFSTMAAAATSTPMTTTPKEGFPSTMAPGTASTSIITTPKVCKDNDQVNCQVMYSALCLSPENSIHHLAVETCAKTCGFCDEYLALDTTVPASTTTTTPIPSTTQAPTTTTTQAPTTTTTQAPTTTTTQAPTTTTTQAPTTTTTPIPTTTQAPTTTKTHIPSTTKASTTTTQPSSTTQEACQDKDSANCQAMYDTMCLSNDKNIHHLAIENCAKTCGFCYEYLVCKDKHQANCQVMYSTMCLSNDTSIHNLAVEMCPESCGFCEEYLGLNTTTPLPTTTQAPTTTHIPTTTQKVCKDKENVNCQPMYDSMCLSNDTSIHHLAVETCAKSCGFCDEYLAQATHPPPVASTTQKVCVDADPDNCTRMKDSLCSSSDPNLHHIAVMTCPETCSLCDEFMLV